jgi:sec-independent protein translocase protein TatA
VIGDILQPTHLLFILVVALLVLGPKRLPEVGRALGRGLRDFRSALSGEERDEMPAQTGPVNFPPPEPDPEPAHEPEPAPTAHHEPAHEPEPAPTAHHEPEPPAAHHEPEPPTAHHEPEAPAGQPAEQPEHVA